MQVGTGHRRFGQDIWWLPLAGGALLTGPGRGNIGAEEGSLYDVLGVDKNASEQEIKKAYKRAAVKFHPDKAPESERPQYEERFKRISRAYEILSDPEKRRAYDLRGESAFDGAGGGAQGGFGPGVDPFDMFRSMFGQNFGFGVARTPDVGYEVEVTMEEMYKGFNKSVRYDRDAVCRTCQGMGATQIETCVFCNGRGVIVEDRQVGPGYFQRVQRHCQRCGGQGAQARNRCSKCRGKGFVKEQVDLNVSAPPGCPDRKRFMFQGKADESPGMETGDIFIELKEKRHDLYTRLNDEDLLLQRKVSLLDALCGLRFGVRHLNGEMLEIASDGVVRPGEVLVVRGYGMPKKQNPRSFGDLLVRIEVDFPQELPAGTQRDAVRQLIDPQAKDESSARWSIFGGGSAKSQRAERVRPQRKQQVEDQLDRQRWEQMQGRKDAQAQQCPVQ